MDPRKFIGLLLLFPVCQGEGRDNQGKEFILCFLDNHPQSSPTDIELFITTMSNTDANVNVTTPLYDPSFLQTAVVQRTQIVKVTITEDIRLSGTALEDKAVWVQSDQEVIVFGVNKETFSTDAYQALPVDVLGTEYYVMTYTEEAEIGIVATENSTDVTVTLPNNQHGSLSVSYLGNIYTNGDTFTFTLNRFETFQVYDDQQDADFTGAHVVANKPISVLGGNKKIDVPYPGSGTSDHLTEQIPPIETLGKTFYTYSTPERLIGDIVRILAVNDSTSISLSDGSSYTLNASDYVELDIPTGTSLSIEADMGVLVALFTKTFQSCCDGSNGGDPAMTFLLPKPQWAADYTYATVRTPSNTEFVNQIIIHIDPTEVDGLRLNQANLTGVTWTNLTGVSDIVVGVIDVNDGTHNIYHIDPAVVFSAISTGVAQHNSYAFATGTRMAPINSPCTNTSMVAADIVDNDCDNRIDEETLNGVDDDGDGLVDEDLASPARVEGNWGSWTSWSNCSETCEAVGNQTRSRNCDNPAPANNGQDCAGNSTEMIVCDMTATDCLVDGNWTAWTSWDNCTGTCETGTQFRERNCTNPVPKGGGLYCSGAENETQTCALTVACPSSSSNTAAIAAGATVGALVAAGAAAACCCLLYPIARKKIFGDDEEEEELPEEGDATTRDVGLEGPEGESSTTPAGTGTNKVSPA